MYPISQFLKYFSRYNLLNKHNFKMAAKQTTSDTKAITHGENIDYKVPETLRMKYREKMT